MTGYPWLNEAHLAHGWEVELFACSVRLAFSFYSVNHNYAGAMAI